MSHLRALMAHIASSEAGFDLTVKTYDPFASSDAAPRSVRSVRIDAALQRWAVDQSGARQLCQFGYSSPDGVGRDRVLTVFDAREAMQVSDAANNLAAFTRQLLTEHFDQP